MSCKPPIQHMLPDTETEDEYLAQFHISKNGFLPAELPLAQLSNPYYTPWESLVSNLPTFLADSTFRDKVDHLPVLSTDTLQTEPERRRAYVVLCFLAHAYVWGGPQAREVLPPQISVPLLSISTALSLPPVATYAALNLWNHASPVPDDLDAVRILHTFTGTRDESWFYAVSIAMEARGADLLPCGLHALRSAASGDFPSAAAHLRQLTRGIADLAALVDRMDEHCDPVVFYARIRPFLAGSLNMASAGLPRGVFYDEGAGRGEWRALRGGSNGQSSLVQFLDAVLGVVHRGGFHAEVRGYMPRAHREFLEQVEGRFPGGVRGVLVDSQEGGEARKGCEEALREATEGLAAFRGRHLQMVTRYIVIPARLMQQGAKGTQGIINLATASSQTVGDSAAVELTGTGGTALLPFLKQTRDETLRAGVVA